MQEFMEKVTAFMAAQQEAEKDGKQEFTCPLCGATAKWSRASRNNHLHAGCSGCGFTRMQ